MYAATRAAGRWPRARIVALQIGAVARAHAIALFTGSPNDFRGLEGIVDVVPVQHEPEEHDGMVQAGSRDPCQWGLQPLLHLLGRRVGLAMAAGNNRGCVVVRRNAVSLEDRPEAGPPSTSNSPATSWMGSAGRASFEEACRKRLGHGEFARSRRTSSLTAALMPWPRSPRSCSTAPATSSASVISLARQAT